MDINEALGELNDFFDDGPCNIHFEAWDTIRRALTGALKPSHNSAMLKLPTVDDCIKHIERYWGERNCWGERNISSKDRLVVSYVLEFIGGQLQQ